MRNDLASILGAAIAGRAQKTAATSSLPSRRFRKFQRTPGDILMRQLNPKVGGTIGPRTMGGYVPGGVPQSEWSTRFIDQMRAGRGALGNTTTYQSSGLPSWWR